MTLAIVASPLAYLRVSAQEFGPAAGTTPCASFLFGSGSVTGGRQITLRVQLDAPAPSGGATVSLSSEDSGVISPPATVTVPEGATESANFRANTSPIADSRNITISASYGGCTVSREVFVRATDLRALYVQSVIRAGGQGKVTICLNGPAPAGGASVRLSTNRPSVLTVPSPVVIPAGDGCISVNAAASVVSSDVAVNVIALYDGIKLVTGTIVRNFDGPTPTPTATVTGTPPTATNTPTTTSTSVPPTATNTSVPPTATNTTVPPTATNTTVPVGPDFTFTNSTNFVASGGTATVQVCYTGPVPQLVTFGVSSDERATFEPASFTYTVSGECTTVTLTDVSGPGSPGQGNVSVEAFIGGIEIEQGPPITFAADPDATSTPAPV